MKKFYTIIFTVFTVAVFAAIHANAAMTQISGTFTGTIESGAVLTNPVINFTSSNSFQYIKLIHDADFIYSGSTLYLSGTSASSAVWGANSGVIAFASSQNAGSFTLTGFDSITPTSTNAKIMTIYLSADTVFDDTDEIGRFAVIVSASGGSTIQVTATVDPSDILTVDNFKVNTNPISRIDVDSSTVSTPNNLVINFKITSQLFNSVNYTISPSIGSSNTINSQTVSAKTGDVRYFTYTAPVTTQFESTGTLIVTTSNSIGTSGSGSLPITIYNWNY